MDENALPLLPLDDDERNIPPPQPAGQQSGSHDLGQLSSITHRLYISHFLSTWNTRVFEFGAVLYLASIFPGTLLPMSIYALCRGLAAVLFSPWVGRYIDTTSRLRVVRESIIYQRLSVVVSCILFYLLSTTFINRPWLQFVCLGLLSAIACIEKLCSIMNLVAVERDWVVVIAGDSPTNLRTLNSQMRRIDLFCKLMGPFLISLADSYSTNTAILLNLGLNILSLPIEYFAIHRVYSTVPALQATKQTPHDSSPRTWTQTLLDLRDQLSTYFTHRTFPSSLAGSLLYFTVLSFSGPMVTYLLTLPFLTSLHIALLRTFSVLSEFSATYLAPLLITRIGPIRAGIWFLSWQMLCLAIGVTSFSFSTSPTLAALGLVAGTIFSRVGLWGFDLSAQVVVQEEVEAERRGMFSAVEAGLQNVCELGAFGATAVWSRPEDFRWPVWGSCGAVWIAGVVYAAFVRSRRGHLVHLCDGSVGRKGVFRRVSSSSEGHEVELSACSDREGA